MKSFTLSFYTYELEQYHGILAYEWLLKFAKQNGIQGGSVFRGIAGFGRSKILHEEHFFELSSNSPIEIIFHVNEPDAEKLLNLLKIENIDLFYVKTPSEYGFINDEKQN